MLLALKSVSHSNDDESQEPLIDSGSETEDSDNNWKETRTCATIWV